MESDEMVVAFAVRLHLRHLKPSILDDEVIWADLARKVSESFPAGTAGVSDWVVHPDPDVIFHQDES